MREGNPPAGSRAMHTRKKLCGFGVFILVLLYSRQVQADSENTLTYFESGTQQFKLNISQTGSFSDFGSYPHWCLGNISKCSGLSVAFWFKPVAANVEAPGITIISNGGHLLNGDGFYVKQMYGNQYEVGVAVATQTWKTSFMLKADNWIHLGFSFSSTNGLEVFVDGLVQTTVSRAEVRDSSSSDYTPVYSLQVGLDQFGQPLTTSSKFSISDILIYDSQSAISDIINPLGKNDHLHLGCSNSLVVSPKDRTDLTGQTWPIKSCRVQCKAKKTAIALILNNASCYCGSQSSTTYTGSCAADDWALYTVSHITEINPDIVFTASTTKLSTKSYTKPGESMLASAGINFNVDVEYVFDFGDGVTVSTDSPPVSHSWSTSGNHTVTVTVNVGLVQKSASTNFIVIDVDEGVAPKLVVITGYHDVSKSLKAYFDVIVADDKSTSCILNFNDGSTPSSLTFNKFVGIQSSNHSFPECGQYVVSASCSNSYGTRNETLTFLARKYEIKFKYQQTGMNHRIKVNGPDSFLDSLTVLVNGSKIQYSHSPNEGWITIDGSHFVSALDNLITVKYNETVLVQNNIHAERRVPKVNIEVGSAAGAWNMSTNLTFDIPPGDHLSIVIDFGAGGESQLYYIHEANTTLPITSAADFEGLGNYGISFTVANDITVDRVSQDISVEVPITNINVTTANITSLSVPLHISVDVNPGAKGPEKVEFVIDYKDGSNPYRESYDNADTTGFTLYSHDYTYSKWGIYVVSVKAFNNISAVTKNVLVQVGENITSFDIIAAKERISVGESVTFFATCPTGSDVTYTFIFGDGTSFSLPESVSGGVKSDNQTSGNVVSQSAVKITHRYDKQGYFKVNATVANVFNSATSPLCPTIIVDAAPTSGPPVCSIPTISFHGFPVTTISSPVSHKRSEKMTIAVDSELQCAVNATSNYSWKAMLVTVSGPNVTETTVHEICLFQELNNTLTIPPLALPYGLYRITVTVAPVGYDLLSSSKDFYLNVIMSEPVAVIAGDDVQQFFIYASAIFDLSGSKDPDLKSNVRKGLSFDVFFMPEMLLTASKTKTLSEMKALSTELVTKTLYRQTTKNRITMYERDTCFNGTSEFIEDVTVYNAKVTFPAKHFVNNYFSFGVVAFVSRNNLVSSTSKIVEIKKSNQSSDDLLSMLDLAKNADPDTAIRICDSAASSILNQEASSVDEQEKLASSTEAVVETLGSVAKRVDNANQASKCARAIKTMTSKKDIVTEGSRSKAAGAFLDLANSTSEMEDATVDDAENFAGETLGGFDNIFPTSAEPVTAKRGRKKKKSEDEEITTVPPFTSESTTPLPTTSTAKMTTTTTMMTTTTAAMSTDPSATNQTSMSSTTTTTMTPIVHSGKVNTEVAVVDNREPIVIAEEMLNDLAELETYDDLFYYIFDDCALFRKVMRSPEVQSNEPCISAETIDKMKCSGLRTMQDQVFWNLTYFEHPGDIYDFYLAPLIRAREIRDEKRRLTDAHVAKAGSRALGTVADTVNEKAPHGDSTERGFQSKRLGLKVQKLNVKGSKDPLNNDTESAEPKSQQMSLSVGSFNMPVDLLSAGGACDDVSTMFLGDSDNAYGFSKEKSSVGKGVISLGYSCGGKKLRIQNADKPIEMWLERNASVYKASKFIKITKWNSADPPTYNYHPVNLTDGNSSLQVILRPGASNEAYDVYVMYDSRPNDTVYDFHDVVPKHNVSYLGNISDPLEEEELMYTVTVPVELTEENGTYWVAIKLKQGTASTSGESTNNTYYLTNLVSGCRFWDDENEKWSSEGCKVGPKTTKYRTQCLCTHLTSFGSDFVVPVNTIDFSNVWAKFGNLSENAAVFSTVIVMLGLYIIGIIWARHMDKKDVLKWGATPLMDNLPTDTYHYQLSVQTGIRKNAGTDSKISFILSGDDGDTGVRRLDDGKRKHFARGSIYNFVLSVEQSLGDLTFLRIWHDNSGKGKAKGWYLDQVQVTNLQTGEKSFFLCDRWLAVEEDDGMVDRICPVAGIEDLVAFKQLFSSSARKKLTNEHLWISVFSRPTRSNFTRVQRISCCMALLFLTMITNCMFFKGEENTSGKVTAITLGPISITLQSLYVSVIGTLIVFPPSFLIVTFFRRCRPKKNAIMQANQQIPKRTQKHKWKNISSASSGMWSSYKLQKSKMQRFREALSGILTFHKKDKYSDDMVEIDTAKKSDAAKKRKKKGWTLPHWCIYIGWGLCVLSIITPAFFTILYSMEWGTKKSNEWLVAFILSFFQSVIVVQPIKVLAIVAFISCIMKKPELDEEELEEDIDNVLKPDEELVKKKDPVELSAIMLQRKMANSNYQPPNTAELELARKLRLNEIQMEAVLKEIITFIFFVMVIFFLSYQQRDPVSYRYATNLKNIFLNGFDSIETAENYWKWLETKYLPALYATQYSNGTEIEYWMDRNCISDLQSRRVAVARLRQMRVKFDTCTVQPEMSKVIHHCLDEYGWTDDDTKPYYPVWTPPPDKENATWLKKQKSPWVYQSAFKLANAPYVATVSTYKGGGYVQLLSRQIYRTKKIITELKDQNWLDTRTRAVFLEFTIYNPNVNLFASCVLVVEFLHSGGAVTRYDFKVFRLMNYIGGFGLIVLLMEVVYACFTLYFFIRCIMQVKKHKLKYFKDFWYIIEFVLLCFAVSCIVMYIFKHLLTELAMRALKDRESDGFVNFQTVALYDELYGYVMSVVVFLATIQFLKLLQFNQKMSMLGDTLRIATKDLKVFSVAFLIYFFSFSALAFLLFGQAMHTYNNFVGASESMFAFALGSFDFEAMTASQPFLGPLFFFAFIGVIYIGMMSIFLTIIGDAFNQVKEDVTLRKNDYEIVDFMCRRIKGLLGMRQ